MWVRFVRLFPGNEAHKRFPWGPNRFFFLGGCQNVYVEEVCVHFPCPSIAVLFRQVVRVGFLNIANKSAALPFKNHWEITLVAPYRAILRYYRCDSTVRYPHIAR